MTKTMIIEGMSCSHCKMRVEKALKAHGEVLSAVIDLNAKSATIELSGDLSDDALKKIVDDAGYDVLEIR